jgi:hypothetical protein
MDNRWSLVAEIVRATLTFYVHAEACDMAELVRKAFD